MGTALEHGDSEGLLSSPSSFHLLTSQPSMCVHVHLCVCVCACMRVCALTTRVCNCVFLFGPEHLEHCTLAIPSFPESGLTGRKNTGFRSCRPNCTLPSIQKGPMHYRELGEY